MIDYTYFFILCVPYCLGATLFASVLFFTHEKVFCLIYPLHIFGFYCPSSFLFNLDGLYRLGYRSYHNCDYLYYLYDGFFFLILFEGC